MSRTMRRTWIITPVSLLALAVGSYAVYRALLPAPLPDGLLYANGRVEGIEIRIASEVTGRVTESRLVEGTQVQQGDLLVRVDDTDLKLRRAQQAAEETGLMRDLERLNRELEGARHHLKTAEGDTARYRDLVARGTISAQRLDQSENALQEARTRAASLEAAVGQGKARLEAIAQNLRLIENQLGKTEIKAPSQGAVLVKAVEPGEFLAPGQLVATIVDLARVELRVYVPEGDIGRIKLGDPARVRIDAFNDRFFQAVVSRVDERAQFTPRDIHVADERVRTVFRVTLALDNKAGYMKPGMPADAWLRWKPDVSWPARLTPP